MSGSALPYALRHNKFVDRRIFIDMLGKISKWITLDKHVYIGMGGSSLEDHKLVHAQFGLRKLISIDGSEAVIARQKFNKPIECVECLPTLTTDFIPILRAELERLTFGGESNLIVWFDYTDPNSLGDQISEFVELLNTMSTGDIVRITINAHAPSLCDSRDPRLPDRTAETLQGERLRVLAQRLGARMPPNVQPENMVPNALPQVILEAFRIAALEALPSEDPNKFQPISAVRYADGQQMLSLTGIILEKGTEESFLEKTVFSEWPYSSIAWTDILSLNIPELTLRERLLLDQMSLSASIEEIREKLGFDFSGLHSRTEEVVTQYRNHGRFYPHFHYVPM